MFLLYLLFLFFSYVISVIIIKTLDFTLYTIAYSPSFKKEDRYDIWYISSVTLSQLQSKGFLCLSSKTGTHNCHRCRTGLCLTSDFFQESSSCFRHAPFCLSSVLRFLPFAGNIQLIFSLYTIYITSAIRFSCSVWHLFISILYFNM